MARTFCFRAVAVWRLDETRERCMEHASACDGKRILVFRDLYVDDERAALKNSENPRNGTWWFTIDGLTMSADASMLTARGDWVFDKSSCTVYYRTAVGKDIAGLNIYAPRLSCVVWIGGADKSRPVRNITISGLRLAHTHWHYKNDPTTFFWADAYCTGGRDYENCGEYIGMPCVIATRFAYNVVIERCRIGLSGGSGVGLGRGTVRSRVIGCEIYDVAGTGIRL